MLMHLRCQRQSSTGMDGDGCRWVVQCYML
jgi:hypothetical protein